MKIPVIQGVIDRRILVNYQVDPQVLANMLPAPFEPKTVNGMGIAGVCLIRLKQIRPRFMPGIVGLTSENAAHRVAVRWKKNGRYQEGVYIPRRDTSLWLNSVIGGRLFPGVHHRARFEVVEHDDRFRVVLDSLDGDTHLTVEARLSTDLPPASIFKSLQTASEFFEAGSLGYSDTGQPGEFDGLELRTFNWQVEPLLVENVESSFFEQPKVFPQGSVKFDCALLMRGIEHEWHGREPLCIN